MEHKYEKLEKVGEGTYGKVYKAKDKATDQLVALKKMHLEMDEEGVPPTALREVSLLQMMSHSLYVVRLLCVEHVNDKKNGKPSSTSSSSTSTLISKSSSIPTARAPVLPLSLLRSSRASCFSCARALLIATATVSFICIASLFLYPIVDLKPRNLLVDKDKGILKIE
ncbi:hypothetical protein RJ640_000127 [Escallonia rubra]|uniref:cyclin-dependent kinase n=1 Tax=Escallonia rubra TaxID=112253 RepID=A0AA88QK26_9ASTE|nr:hypothetical protein RJ640_000127 [Escallonia rubra]